MYNQVCNDGAVPCGAVPNTDYYENNNNFNSPGRIGYIGKIDYPDDDNTLHINMGYSNTLYDNMVRDNALRTGIPMPNNTGYNNTNPVNNNEVTYNTDPTYNTQMYNSTQMYTNTGYDSYGNPVYSIDPMYNSNQTYDSNQMYNSTQMYNNQTYNNQMYNNASYYNYSNPVYNIDPMYNTQMYNNNQMYNVNQMYSNTQMYGNTGYTNMYNNNQMYVNPIYNYPLYNKGPIYENGVIYNVNPTYEDMSYDNSDYKDPIYTMYSKNVVSNGMGTYYTTNYLMHLQREQQQKYYEEQVNFQKNQEDIKRRLIRAVESYTGNKILPEPMTEEEKERMQKIYQEHIEIEQYNYLSNLLRRRTDNYVSKRRQDLEDHLIKCTQIAYQFIDKDISFEDFMNNGYKLIIYNMEEEERRRLKNLIPIYNKASYKSRLDPQESIMFDSLKINPFHLDDMEVTLPDSIKNEEYHKRRSEFMSRIINKSEKAKAKIKV